MAEVPEVEVIVQDLRAAAMGRMLVEAEVLLPAAIRFPAPAAFVDLLAGRCLTGATRRAKHILIDLDNDLVLALHFMLWGWLRLQPSDTPRPRHTLLAFALDNGDELRFGDELGFARAALAPAAELAQRLKLHELGPEALDPSFAPPLLAERLARRRGALKTVLLNQNVVAGLGNRDADESLWQAGLDPQRSPASLDTNDIVRLHGAMRAVLDEGLRLRGTMPDLWGRPGGALHHRNVFGRTGQPCPRCGTPIKQLRIGDRRTHYCPNCQH
jgi:formamidopyrimidine-DNA glycosylase